MKKILIVAMLLSGSAFGQAFTFSDLTLDEKCVYADRMKAHWNKVRNRVRQAQRAVAEHADQEADATISEDERADTQGSGVVMKRRIMRDVAALQATRPTPREVHQETLDAAIVATQAEVDRLESEAELDSDALAAAIAACEDAEAAADAFRGEGG